MKPQDLIGHGSGFRRLHTDETIGRDQTGGKSNAHRVAMLNVASEGGYQVTTVESFDSVLDRKNGAVLTEHTTEMHFLSVDVEPEPETPMEYPPLRLVK